MNFYNMEPFLQGMCCGNKRCGFWFVHFCQGVPIKKKINLRNWHAFDYLSTGFIHLFDSH